MVKKIKIDNEEINLIDLFYILWKDKWKIAVAVVISLIAMMTYQSTKIKNFTAITEIKPISTLKLNKFFEFNNMIANTNTGIDTNTNTNINTNTGTNINTNASERINIAGKINKITRLKLLNIYINVLNDRKVIEDAIRKFNLLEASQYNNDQEYSDEIVRLASSVKILPPSASDELTKRTSYSTISFTYHDAEKWKSVLTYVDKFANKLVKRILNEEYKNALIFLKSERKYLLEDISIKINNLLIDYEREISDRLVYLKEQEEIAKKLGIKKNTIEVEIQTFGNQNALVSNFQTDSPFYLRGYEAINKEIELIGLRDDKKAFITGLFKLEKEKRAIEQDQTIERVELALQSNLLKDSNQFTAASINVVTTRFEYNDYKHIHALVILAGLIVGIFYVLISNAFKPFRFSKKN